MDELRTSRCTLTIKNVRGLHARASAKFVKCAEKFDAEVNVTCKDQTVPGTSIMGLMMLGASPGTDITIVACGLQHKQAIAALARLVQEKFHEE